MAMPPEFFLPPSTAGKITPPMLGTDVYGFPPVNVPVHALSRIPDTRQASLPTVN